jgi:hypothetical protein
MAFYKKCVVVRDTPAMVAERLAYRKAVEQARFDREMLFPVITAENFEAACRYQDRVLAQYLVTGVK